MVLSFQRVVPSSELVMTRRLGQWSSSAASARASSSRRRVFSEVMS